MALVINSELDSFVMQARIFIQPIDWFAGNTSLFIWDLIAWAYGKNFLLQ